MANEAIKELTAQDYKWGFTSAIESDVVPAGLNEDVIRMISAKKQEPEWLLEWRLKAYRDWLPMKEPHWANVTYPPIDYQAIRYYAAPKKKPQVNSLDEIDPEIRSTFEKLGISLDEQKRLSGIAVDAVLDSVSVATTFKDKLKETRHHLLFFLGGRARASGPHPSVSRNRSFRTKDNFFAALNSAVFTDGSFCYIPKGVRCPMELSTYFRINASETGPIRTDA